MQRMARLSAPREALVIAALAAASLPTMYGTHPGEGIRHWVAAAIAAVGGLSIVAVVTRRPRVDLMAAFLSACSGAAATVHFAVISEHVEEFWLFGVFFVLAALAQALFAVLVVERPSRVVYLAGAVGNAAIVVLWVVSRTVGVPVGPNGGEAETVGAADVVTTLLELILVGGCVASLLRPLRVRVHRTLLAALLVGAAAVTTVALVSVTGVHAHHGDDQPAHPHHE